MRVFASTMLMIGAVLSAFTTPFPGQWVLADSVEPGTEEAGLDTSALCNPEDIAVHAPQPSSTSERTYGLAVDVTGIGGPGTPSSLLWHEIAARHGVICPYGPHNLLEWNHCQPTWVRLILAEDPLRETVTADGPISLQGMFEVGYSVIAASSSVGGLTGDPPAHSAMEHRITAAANIRTAYERGPPQTYRSIFDSRVKKSPRLYVDKLGWPKGVPRIANLEGEPRRPKSSATSRILLKPIVMPRMIGTTTRPKVTGARQAGPGPT